VLFVHLPLESVYAKTAKRARNKRTPRALRKRLKGITRAGKARQLKLLQKAIAGVAKSIAHEAVAARSKKRISRLNGIAV
jgi:hypothetical protein